MLNFIRAVFFCLFESKASNDANSWARLEFGRDAIKSDFDGRLM